MSYSLTFAGIPFDPSTAEDDAWIRDNIPHHAALSVLPPSPFPGKNLFGLAVPPWNELPVPRLGEFYYPTGASRWAQFRGLATTTQKLAMEQAALANGASAQPFVVQCDDIGNPGQSTLTTTKLFMLPARPLAQHGGGYDGMWLIELCDERFYWQTTMFGPTHPTASATWASLIAGIGSALGVSIRSSGITSVYLSPEPDSQFWTNYENPAILLDAIAWNIGTIPVRNLDGSYTLQRFTEGDAVATANRGAAANVRRLAGGDLLTESSTTTPVPAVQALLPASVTVSFPRYITGVGQSGSAQIPHFKNSRFSVGQSRWIEDSYGDVYAKTITLAAAGYAAYRGSPGSTILHTTAKALYNGESDANPSNQSTCDALALQMAQDLYAYLSPPAFDEVYPGTVAWVPECGHDLLWTYRREGGSLRVTRSPWNYYPSEFQHSTGTPSGVGGKSVALAIQDSQTPTPNRVDGVNVITFVNAGVTVSSGVSSAGLQEALVNFSRGSASVFMKRTQIIEAPEPPPQRVTKVFPTISLPPTVVVKHRHTQETVYETPHRPIKVFPTVTPPAIFKRNIFINEPKEVMILRPTKVYPSAAKGQNGRITNGNTQTFTASSTGNNVLSAPTVSQDLVEFNTTTNVWTWANTNYRYVAASIQFQNTFFSTTAVQQFKIYWLVNGVTQVGGYTACTVPNIFGFATITLQIAIEQQFNAGDTLQLTVDNLDSSHSLQSSFQSGVWSVFTNSGVMANFP